MSLLELPAYQPLWAAARRRVESNGLSLEGTPLTLKDLTSEESDAIAGLLGVRRPSAGSPLRVPLAGLDRALRSSSIGHGLLDVLTTLGGPLADRRAAKSSSTAERAALWAALEAHPAVARDHRLTDWLDHVRTTGLDRRLGGADGVVAVAVALDVLAVLDGDTRHRLAVLAAEVVGDAHGLDRGRAAGTLAVHALSWRQGDPFPQDAADWRRAWADAGVACDDLSCDVLALNLPGFPAEPLRLTLRQVMSWQPPACAEGVVFACENPAVVAAAADRRPTRRLRSCASTACRPRPRSSCSAGSPRMATRFATTAISTGVVSRSRPWSPARSPRPRRGATARVTTSGPSRPGSGPLNSPAARRRRHGTTSWPGDGAGRLGDLRGTGRPRAARRSRTLGVNSEGARWPEAGRVPVSR